jgi:uncharacterized protein
MTMPSAKRYIFFNVTRDRPIVTNGWIADNAIQRMRGLLGFDHLEKDEGLLLRPGNSIHMCGMKFAIDVIFVDRRLKVVRIAENLPPQPRWTFWRMTAGGWRAHSCFELPVGAVKQSQTHIGDQLTCRPNTG